MVKMSPSGIWTQEGESAGEIIDLIALVRRDPVNRVSLMKDHPIMRQQDIETMPFISKYLTCPTKPIRSMAVPRTGGEEIIETEIMDHGHLGFPTSTRPVDFLRDLETNQDLYGPWSDTMSILFGEAVKPGTSEWNALAQVLYTWKDCFAEDVREMPPTTLVEHRIPTYPTTIPRAASVRRYSPEEIEWQHENLPKMEEAGIIMRCLSPWSSRTKFVRKPDGRFRFVHQYMALNDATVKMNYPMKRIEPILNMVAQTKWKWFFKADAANGYWAVPLALEHAYKTAFPSLLGQFCYLRMGQGLTGAPGTYSRLKDLFAAPIPAPCAEPGLDGGGVGFECFQDDDIGAFETFTDQLRFLHERYFPRLKWAGLTLNPKKTQFCVRRTKILGHERTVSGLRPSADKIRALTTWPVPESEADLMRFVYTLPFLKVYIPGRADMIAILKQAVISEGKGAKRRVIDFIWTKVQQRVFNRIKSFFPRITLSGGDPHLQYHLATDASNTGLGGVLFQMSKWPIGTRTSRNTVEDETVIMFMSFALSDAETRYHTTEKEALAVLKCLEEVHWLVMGADHPVILYTDHLALKTVLGANSDATGRIARWQYRLQEYNLSIHHVPGKTQIIADGLSRVPHWSIAEPVDEDGFNIPTMQVSCNLVSEQGPQWETDLFARFRRDVWYGAIVDRLLRHSRKSSDKRFHLIVKDGAGFLVYREKKGDFAECIQRRQLQPVLVELHDVHGHYASRITLGRALGRYYWPTRFSDINFYCNTCPQCQLIGPRIPKEAPHSIAVMEPMTMFAIDFIGPFNPPSEQGHRFIIVGCDYMTRFSFASPTIVNTAQVAFSFLEDKVARVVGWPVIVYSDNGSHFTGADFTGQLEERSIRHIRAGVRAPWSVGLAERLVAQVVRILRVTAASSELGCERWNLFVEIAVQSINSRVVPSLGFSPAQVMLGFQPTFFGPAPLQKQLLSEVIEQELQSRPEDWIDMSKSSTVHLERLDDTRRIVQELAVNKSATAANAGSRRTMAAGDLVLLRKAVLDNVKGRKLETRWSGPYQIARMLANGRSAILNDLSSGLRVGKFHMDHLKLFVPRSEHPIEEARDLAARNEHLGRVLHEVSRQSKKMKEVRKGVERDREHTTDAQF
jgi:hypothetical protein